MNLLVSWSHYSFKFDSSEPKFGHLGERTVRWFVCVQLDWRDDLKMFTSKRVYRI